MVPPEKIDELILARAQPLWRKVAYIVGSIANDMNATTDKEYETAAARIAVLVETGKLEAQGNLQDWRHSEVRLPSQSARDRDKTAKRSQLVERRLELTTGGEAVLRFLTPQRIEEDSWRCAYEIEWPDRERRFFGCGVDAVQALIGAMCNAHADLLSSPEHKADALRWLGMRDLGLPLAGDLKPTDFS